MFKKIINYDTNQNIELEIYIQNYISSKYDFCPKIIEVINHTEKCEIIMEDLKEKCLADKYGENFDDDLPDFIKHEIHNIISILYEREGIEYIDITPYNFIEKDKKVYIIDFGHAYFVDKNKKINWFLKDFLDGLNSWNPDFK